jgi:hypothetical protein
VKFFKNWNSSLGSEPILTLRSIVLKMLTSTLPKRKRSCSKHFKSKGCRDSASVQAHSRCKIIEAITQTALTAKNKTMKSLRRKNKTLLKT